MKLCAPKLVLVSHLALAILLASGPILAQDEGKPAKQPTENTTGPEKTESKYKLPEGSLTDQLDYLIEVAQTGPEDRTQAGVRNFIAELTPLAGVLAGKMLKSDEKGVAILQAVQIRIELLQLSMRFGLIENDKELNTFLELLKKDMRPLIADFAKYQDVSSKVEALLTSKPDERAKVAAAVIEFVTAPKEVQASHVQLSSETVRMLGYSGDYKLAATTADTLSKLIAKSTDPRFARSAKFMAGAARRFRLPGHEMKITGKTHDGEDFDWSSYRGKVVLVDFWATWCGPCLQELPNVEANYKKYHDKGFDVVGISIDEDLDRLSAFLDDRKLPWVNLTDSAAETSNATYYGVSGIPNTILVGRDGKVIELNVRGAKLGVLLEKHLGGNEATESAGDGTEE